MSEKLSISDVKAKLATLTDENDQFVSTIVNDERKGVKTALQSFHRRIERNKKMKQGFEQRLSFERQFWNAGDQYVAGIDEVGRGPLAGPVVTAAVIIDSSFDLLGVTDSKQLTAHERETLYLKIVKEAVEVNIAVKDNQIIDQYNIYATTKIAMNEAINGLRHRPTQLIVDAVPLDIDIPQTTLIKGDQKSVSVAAASIVAKEYRDHLMQDYDQIYPGYDFANNMGYGTAKHLSGLKKLGITPIHRHSFAPVRKFE